MPLDSIADLERRIRRLEMELDQYKHKFVAPDRTVKTELPSIPFGKWTSFTPAYKGWVADSVTGFQYSVIGNTVFLLIDMTDGTSNNTDAKISCLKRRLNSHIWRCDALAMDNGDCLTQATIWYIGGKFRKFRLIAMSNGAWTASVQSGYDVWLFSKGTVSKW
jgi:hypothetical protein